MSDLNLELVEVLPRDLEPVYSNIRQVIESSFPELTALYLVPLTTFFNHDASGTQGRIWHDLYLGRVVDVALVRRGSPQIGGKRKALVACLFRPVGSGRNPRTTKRMVQQLEEVWGVPCYVGDMKQSKDVQAFVEKAAQIQGSKGNVTGRGEQWLLNSMRMALLLSVPQELKSPFLAKRLGKTLERVIDQRNAKYRIYHEISLGEIMRVSNHSAQLKKNSLGSPPDLHKYACDALLATVGYRESDNSWVAGKPILVLEYDGPCHDRPDQKSRDEKRDILLSEAGICVLRIRHLVLDELDRREGKDLMNLYFRHFFGFLLYELASSLEKRNDLSGRLIKKINKQRRSEYSLREVRPKLGSDSSERDKREEKAKRYLDLYEASNTEVYGDPEEKFSSMQDLERDTSPEGFNYVCNQGRITFHLVGCSKKSNSSTPACQIFVNGKMKEEIEAFEIGLQSIGDVSSPLWSDFNELSILAQRHALLSLAKRRAKEMGFS